MKKEIDTFEISIHLDQPDTLRLKFPKEKHEHVSLTLSGGLGNDDVDFLTGDAFKENIIDEDTGEVVEIPVHLISYTPITYVH